MGRSMCRFIAIPGCVVWLQGFSLSKSLGRRIRSYSSPSRNSTKYKHSPRFNRRISTPFFSPFANLRLRGKPDFRTERSHFGTCPLSPCRFDQMPGIHLFLAAQRTVQVDRRICVLRLVNNVKRSEKDTVSRRGEDVHFCHRLRPNLPASARRDQLLKEMVCCPLAHCFHEFPRVAIMSRSMISAN